MRRRPRAEAPGAGGAFSGIPQGPSSWWVLLVAGLAALLGACAPSRYDYQSTLYMDQLDAARQRARIWPGPAVRFSVTDIRVPESFTEQPLADGRRWPQEAIYDEARDFTFPIDDYIARLLAERELPDDAVLERTDICLTAYDYSQRKITEEVVQHEIFVRYGFRPTPRAPCPGNREFLYAAWGVWGAGGETPARTRSEALPALIDHIQRSYLFDVRSRMTLLIPELDVMLDSPDTSETWAPPAEEIKRFRYQRTPQAVLAMSPALAVLLPPYMGGLNVNPAPVQQLPAARRALIASLAGLLAPDIRVRQVREGEPGPPPSPTESSAHVAELHVTPVFVGVAGEDIALVRLRVRLKWPSGEWIYNEALSGTCAPSPLSPCTVYQQLETIAIVLRSQMPALFSDPKPIAPSAPVGSVPEPQPIQGDAP